jgi:GntR family transcriptional regulator
VNTRISEPPRSKHALIAEALSGDIQGGKYKVGDLLPSEAELGAAFGVSRHTVRIALRTLHSLGLVTSQQGVGTQVHKDQLAARYSHAFNSASDLLQYATSTRPRLIDIVQIVVDSGQSEYLGCKTGEHWWRVRTLRFAASGDAPVAYSEIHIPLAFGAVLADIAKSTQPIFALIEERFHESMVEIRQDICAVTMSNEEARHLNMPRKAPGLEITRRYVGKSGRVLEAARSVHPSGSFKYTMDVQLKHGA